jgi:hypothetical protein
MQTVLDERSLDWAIIHLTRFCDNDFFPAAFEFQVFADNWQELRNHVLAIDLDSYVPRPPLVRLAPKATGSYRILHRLDPIDSLIYTALVHEFHEALQKVGGAESEGLIRSLRVELSADGQFFSTGRNAWQQYTERVETLATGYQVCGSQNAGGYVVVTDIHDFYGHIQPRRLVQMLIDSKAIRPDRAQALGRFLPPLCTGTGRGVPAGPGATAVLAEMVLADIDLKIASFTRDFARWGDDLCMFFRTRVEAEKALSDLSTYLHSVHEMTLVPQKTGIVPADQFLAGYRNRLPKETIDAGAAELKLNGFVGQHSHPIQYGWMTSPLPQAQPMSVHARLRDLPDYYAVGTAYHDHFDRAAGGNPPDLIAAKRIMRKAAVYRLDTILPSVLGYFDKLTPIIRETAIYLKAVLDEEHVLKYAREIRNVWENRLHSSTYINEWMCHVLTNPGFNRIDLPRNYSEMVDIRSKALIALRKKDADWVRRHAAHLDSFDLWDRRAVLFACSVLSSEERASVSGVRRRGITERSVARHIDPAGTGSSGGYGEKIAGPDNYPAYGTKAVEPSPRWLTERIPELDTLLRERGAEIMVSIQDSVDSGNCMDGTEAFVRELLVRLGLPAGSTAVSASALLSERDDPLTRRAARAAALRCASTRGSQPS